MSDNAARPILDRLASLLAPLLVDVLHRLADRVDANRDHPLTQLLDDLQALKGHAGDATPLQAPAPVPPAPPEPA